MNLYQNKIKVLFLSDTESNQNIDCFEKNYDLVGPFRSFDTEVDMTVDTQENFDNLDHVLSPLDVDDNVLPNYTINHQKLSNHPVVTKNVNLSNLSDHSYAILSPTSEKNSGETFVHSDISLKTVALISSKNNNLEGSNDLSPLFRNKKRMIDQTKDDSYHRVEINSPFEEKNNKRLRQESDFVEDTDFNMNETSPVDTQENFGDSRATSNHDVVINDVNMSNFSSDHFQESLADSVSSSESATSLPLPSNLKFFEASKFGDMDELSVKYSDLDIDQLSLSAELIKDVDEYAKSNMMYSFENQESEKVLEMNSPEALRGNQHQNLEQKLSPFTRKKQSSFSETNDDSDLDHQIDSPINETQEQRDSDSDSDIESLREILTFPSKSKKNSQNVRKQILILIILKPC